MHTDTIVRNRVTLSYSALCDLMSALKIRNSFAPGTFEWGECTATQRALAMIVADGYNGMSGRYREIFQWLTTECVEQPGRADGDVVNAMLDRFVFAKCGTCGGTLRLQCELCGFGGTWLDPIGDGRLKCGHCHNTQPAMCAGHPEAE